ncbi:hypothetical protein [Methanolobus sp.]|uniref:hypothetical protein n=1 Tax=Methanolobus sp. TaxID=1874737 RepID=UPI0025D0CEBA|nr:hypothetical protein [Methanolobus sp.]
MAGLSDQVVSLLEPHIGKTMAQASVKTQCKKIGITPEQLSSAHLNEFTKYLQAGLNLFVGNEKAELITKKIEQMK